METTKSRDQRLISTWLLVGLIMVFVQIILGGITRLTGSGLSITRWDIVTGLIPPINIEQWKVTFELYKQTPQYKQINTGFDLSQFKFIFFWEYFHRLWARLMGFAFVIPFVYFLLRKSLSISLLRRLVGVIALAGLAAVFGWIMVSSGLISRPWVNAYKLTIHLGLGIALFISLFLAWLHHRGFRPHPLSSTWQNSLKVLLVLVIIQIAFGGFVSGMKSSLNYPTWPLMNGSYIPEIILDKGHWNVDNFLLYDKSGFMPALVQFVHRNLGYVIAVLTTIFAVRWHQQIPASWLRISYSLIGIIVIQIILGILTLLNSKGGIPVFYGTLHQGIGILFLTFLIYIYEVIKPIKI